jgi:hypothetical protein
MLRHSPLALVVGAVVLTAACGTTGSGGGASNSSGTSSGSSTSGATTTSGAGGGSTTSGAGGSGTGGSSTTSGAGGSSTTTSGAGGGTTTSGAGGGTPNVQCAGSPPVFPSFDKACTVDADCAVVFHQINCCGTRRALGIVKGKVVDFGAAEAICESQYPGCGCAQQPTMADDGNASADESLIKVSCSMSACTTFVP